MGTLYVVSTPIGNLEDITLRALRVLRDCDLVATEDTRNTGRLLNHFDIKKPLVSYYEHNKMVRLERLLEALGQGDVALVSDAGTPLVSDPGYELVQAAIERGVTVVPVPGVSALTAALCASGLATDRFHFLGFLPRKRGDRQRLLVQVNDLQATLVFFEAPHRLVDCLADAVSALGGERQCAVCRELTKMYEEIWRGTLEGAQAEWRVRRPRGEFTVVVEGARQPQRWDEGRVRVALAARLAAGVGHSEAAREIAHQSGWPKSAVYDMWPDVT